MMAEIIAALCVLCALALGYAKVQSHRARKALTALKSAQQHIQQQQQVINDVRTRQTLRHTASTFSQSELDKRLSDDYRD